MAFATRSIRIWCKLYGVNNVGADYSTLRRTISGIALFRVVKKCYSTQIPQNTNKLSESLTNILSPNLGSSNPNEKSQHEKSKEDEETQKAKERSSRMSTLGAQFLGLCAGIGVFYWAYTASLPLYDEHGNIIEDEFSDLIFPQRIYRRMKRDYNYFNKWIQEPSREKLLPDPFKLPYVQPPYTLVLEMTDLLVHPEWTYQTGWRFKKRPGIDAFLKSLHPHFEVVIYTAEQGMVAHSILDTLDPNGFIWHRLYRDSTKFMDGNHVKDLGALNRDLSKVLVIDWNSQNVKLHPENAFVIPRWAGNDDDMTLYDLNAFLQAIHTTNVEDVRDVLNHYRQYENPLDIFKQNQQKFELQMEEKRTQRASTTKWTPSFLRH